MTKYYKSELTVSYESNSRSKNFFGILISILVLMLISSLIVAAIVIINPDIGDLLQAPPTRPREAISLEESLLDGLGPSSFASQWLANQDPLSGQLRDELLFEDSKNLQLLPMDLLSPNEATLKSRPTTLVSNGSLLASVEYQGFRLSPSKRYLLIWNARRRQFRHSFTARYFVYDILADQILMLSTGHQPQAAPGLEQLISNRSTGGQLPLLHNTYESLDTAANYLSSRLELDDQQASTRFQAADWFEGENSADGLLLVQSNDIYVLANLSGPEVQPQRLTFDGREGEIFNGLPDWLYEEEILADAPAYQVNPDGRSLAYMSFNDSQVEQIQFPIYGSASQIIPQPQKIRYPKAGRPNPRVSVHLVEEWHLPSRRAVELELPEELARQQHYIYRIRWLSRDRLALTWLNRNQNHSCVVVCSRQDAWLCRKNLELKSPGGWLDMNDDLFPLDDDSYLMIVPKFEGPEVGNFKHVARVQLDKLNSFTYLTSGRREVLAIEGVNQASNTLYYSSSVPNEPGQRQLYAGQLLRSSSEEPKAADACITCDHYPEECLYNYVKLSPSTSFYLFECEGPAVPRVELRSMKPLSIPAPAATKTPPGKPQATTTLIWSIEDNQTLRYKLEQQKMMPVSLRLKVPIAGGNYSANVHLLLPPELTASTSFRLPESFVDKTRGRRSAASQALSSPSSLASASAAAAASKQRPFWRHLTEETLADYVGQLSSGQQWPLVVDVYAGPGSQRVDFRYGINFGHYLSSSRRAVYALIDGRGSANQGTRRLYELYRKFGTVEIEDQIEASRWLAHKLSFINKHKVAIWGWSYGGYAAAMALAKSSAPQALASNGTGAAGGQLLGGGSGSRRLVSGFKGPQEADGVFECAASVAPVTNWIYYDTAYTERYMSSPYANELYDETLPGDHLDKARDTQTTSGQDNRQQLQQQRRHMLKNRWSPLNGTLGSMELKGQLPVGERPETNQLSDHYKAGSLLDQIGRIERKKFLLIHGTADDNVHFQQSIQLMKRLISRNILFETRLYPDQDHGIANRADKLHLGASLSHFFDECFDSNH